MRRAIINPDKCQNCEQCQITLLCKEDVVIREQASDKPWLDFYKCRGCMKCLRYCQFGAVEELAQPCDANQKMSW